MTLWMAMPPMTEWTREKGVRSLGLSYLHDYEG